jgi:hypothetical protein
MWGSFWNFVSSYRRTRDIGGGGLMQPPVGHLRLSKSLGHLRVKTVEPFKQHARPSLVHHIQKHFASAGSCKRCQLGSTYDICLFSRLMTLLLLINMYDHCMYFESKWWPTDIVCKSPQKQSFLCMIDKAWSSILFERLCSLIFCRFADLTSWLFQLSINSEVFASDFHRFPLVHTEK